MWRWVSLIASVTILCGLLWGTRRVVELETSELDYRSEWVRLVPTAEPGGGFAPHREIGRISLAAGETVTVEVCAQDRLLPDRWGSSDIQFALWIPASQKVVARRPLVSETLAEVSRGAGEACLTLARGGDLVESGDYAVEAIWAGRELPPEISRVPIRAHIMAFRPASVTERWSVVVVLVGSLLIVVALTGWRSRRRRRLWEERAEDEAVDVGDRLSETGDHEERKEPAVGHWAALRVGLGLATLLIAGFTVGYIPLGGALGALLRALTLAAVQVVMVVALIRLVRDQSTGFGAALGFGPPRHGKWALLIAVVAGFVLWLVGQGLLRWIPATGESAVGAVVAWPSGSLAVALASVVSPLVEEVFFRGFVFGTLERRYGTAVAFATTSIVFALAHLPQTWGAWGGFAAVSLTGVGLTALRAWSRSLAVPALAHLIHNGAITLLWVVLVQT